MANRNSHDWSHFNFNCGDIGKLQTLSVLPVVAGDSVTVELEGVWRLSPLRRNMVVDCAVDMFCFFVPHRHIYGQQWIDFIKAGHKETETFPTTTAPALENIDYLGSAIDGGETFPQWLNGGYNQIWNRYFRSPTDANTRSLSYLATDLAERDSGFRCGYLPTPWSTGVLGGGVGSSEREVPIVLDTMDIVALDRVQAEYKTNVDRVYFGQRYNDILKTQFGTTVNTDADQRPTLCAHEKWWLSGHDVDATDDASLGSYSGKSVGMGRLKLRRKFFSEHGAIWIMVLLRFPTIHERERPFLNHLAQPGWNDISGDPSLLSALPPVDATSDTFFRGDAATVIGTIPDSNWYRYKPSTVHRLYDALEGYTFTNSLIDSPDKAHYIVGDEYDDVFQTTQLRHWNSACRIGATVQSVVPGGRVSLYAGV